MTLRQFTKDIIAEWMKTGEYGHLISRPRRGGGIEIHDIGDNYLSQTLICTIRSTRRIVDEYRVGKRNEFQLTDTTGHISYEYGKPRPCLM